MKPTWKPVGKTVLVECLLVEKESTSPILVSEEKEKIYRVLSVGETCTSNIMPGHQIMFSDWLCTIGDNLYVVAEDKICAQYV